MLVVNISNILISWNHMKLYTPEGNIYLVIYAVNNLRSSLESHEIIHNLKVIIHYFTLFQIRLIYKVEELKISTAWLYPVIHFFFCVGLRLQDIFFFSVASISSKITKGTQSERSRIYPYNSLGTNKYNWMA